jgi:hypothetical protein
MSITFSICKRGMLGNQARDHFFELRDHFTEICLALSLKRSAQDTQA